MKRSILTLIALSLGFGALPMAAQASNGYCREYQQKIRIDGRWVQGYGTACLQPDGSWHAVSAPQSQVLIAPPAPQPYYAPPVHYPSHHPGYSRGYASAPSFSLYIGDDHHYRKKHRHNRWKRSYGHKKHKYRSHKHGHGHGRGHGKGHGKCIRDSHRHH